MANRQTPAVEDMTTVLQPDDKPLDSHQANNVSGRIGMLSTRLAESKAEIRHAQHIRYKVFCRELNASSGIRNRITQRDEDRFDGLCDHLLMLDNSKSGLSAIIGTQRFHVGDKNTESYDFYSSGEFEISDLTALHPEKRFMELGRSCILPEYRNRRTMELLWHGTWQYALYRNADVMFGCASFHTNNPEEIEEELGFLAGVRIDTQWNVGSKRDDRIDLMEFKRDSIGSRSAIKKLPPLIKGYLRLGAGFSRYAVPDREFGTIDVLVVLPLSAINPRYIAHYGSSATRHNR